MAQKPAQVLLGKVGASNAPKGKADLSRFEPGVYDQGGTESCTAHAASRCLVVRYAALGKPLPFIPSMLAIWSASVLDEASPVPTPAELLAMNTGVASMTAMIAIGRGIRAMGPLSPDGRFSDVAVGPVAAGLDQMTAEALRPQVGEYRLDETDSSWPTLAACCLDSGIPVYVGMNVGPIYDGWMPNMPPIDTDEVPSETANGGHAVELRGYETTSSGLVFTSTGSYGTGFADQGVWRFTARGLMLRCFDAYAMEVS
jgi:hypothetical protein